MNSSNIQIVFSASELALIYSLLTHVRLGGDPGPESDAFSILNKLESDKIMHGPEIFDSFVSFCNYHDVYIPNISWDDEMIYAE